MSLYKQLKEDHKQVRLARNDALKATTLGLIIDGAQKEAKKTGRDEADTTDDQVITAVRRFIKNANEMIETGGADNIVVAHREIEIVSVYLPKQVSQTEVNAYIDEIQSGVPTIGAFMVALNAKFGKGNFDAKASSEYAKAALAK